MDVLETTDVLAVSSPVPETLIPESTDQNTALETFSDAERSAWLKDGTLPKKSAGAQDASVTGKSRPGASEAEPAPS